MKKFLPHRRRRLKGRYIGAAVVVAVLAAVVLRPVSDRVQIPNPEPKLETSAVTAAPAAALNEDSAPPAVPEPPDTVDDGVQTTPVSLRVPEKLPLSSDNPVVMDRAKSKSVDHSEPAAKLIRSATLGERDEIRPQFDRLAVSPGQPLKELTQALRRPDQIMAIQLSYGFRSVDRAVAAQAADAAAKVALRGTVEKRLLAVECAGIIGIETPLLTQALQRAAGDRDARLRYRTAAAIGRIEKPSDGLVAVLDKLAGDKAELVSSRVQYSIATLSSGDPVLAAKWQTPLGSTARAALHTADAESDSHHRLDLSAEMLLQKLRRGDSRTRATAAMIAAVRDNSDPELLSALEANLYDSDERVRFAASYALGQIGLPAVPALLRGLKNEHAPVRSNVVQALKQIQPQTDEIKAALGTALRDSSPEVRLQAALAFVALGIVDDTACNILTETLGLNFGAIEAVAPVLAKAEMQPWIPKFTAALSSNQPRIRAGAARALGLMGPAATSALDPLVKAADDSDKSVRTSAITAAAAIRGH